MVRFIAVALRTLLSFVFRDSRLLVAGVSQTCASIGTDEGRACRGGVQEGRCRQIAGLGSSILHEGDGIDREASGLAQATVVTTDGMTEATA